MRQKTMFKGYLLVITSAFLFGCMPLITKNIYAQGVNSLSVVFLRNLLSIPVLGALTFWKDRTLRVPAKALLPIAAIGLTGCCITPFLLFTSYNFLASGTATVLHFIYPSAVVLASIIFLRKKPHIGSIVSVIICAVGIGLFYDPTTLLNPFGALLALVSGITYAAYVVLLSVCNLHGVKGFRLAFYLSVICTVVMAPIFLVSGGITFPTSVIGWLLCFLLAVVINVGAVILFQQGTLLIGGERAAILSTVEPVTGVFIGAVAFQEIISVRSAVGSVLVIAASILIAISDMKNKKTRVS